MKRTLLIDADSLIYAAASSNQTAVQWDEDTWSVDGNFEGARVQLDGDIEKLKDTLKADVIVLAISDYTDPWRKKVLPSYKENRKAQPKPILLKPLRDYCHEQYTTFQRPGLEADDVLGILLTAVKPPPPVEGERILCSIDKDMQTLPGLHFNWQKDAEVRVVTVAEADRFHMVQTLTGDTVDGYKGLPGCGPKKAVKVLSEEQWPGQQSLWVRVLAAYEKAGLSEADTLIQARVARICRASDYDFKKKEVILWNPT